MFFSFTTIPADCMQKSGKSDKQPTAVRTALTWFFLVLYIALMAFAAISTLKPEWLQGLAKVGKKAESMHYKHYGDTFLLQRQDYLKAIAQYRRSLEIKPDNIGALVNMGVAYMKLGDERKGMIAFKEALRKENVRKGIIYYNLAEQLEAGGKTEEALRYYERSLGRDVDPVMVHRSLGQLHISLGNFEQARASFEAALEEGLSVAYLYRRMLQRTASASEGDSVYLPVIETALASEITDEDMQEYDLEIIQLTRQTDRDISRDYLNIGLTYQMTADTANAIENYRLSLNIWSGNMEANNALKTLTSN